MVVEGAGSEVVAVSELMKAYVRIVSCLNGIDCCTIVMSCRDLNLDL